MRGLIHGRVRLTVRSKSGVLLAEREAENIVLRSGASIIAALFSGGPGGNPIDRIAVGFARESATAETTALTPPEGGTIPAEALQSTLAEDSFEITADLPSAVRVSVRALFKPTTELNEVTEAGLLAGDRLYNQVVFEPVTLRPGQDVTFFWEIDFPFGH